MRLLFILFLLQISSINAQHAYFHALKIKSDLDNSKEDPVVDSLLLYFDNLNQFNLLSNSHLSFLSNRIKNKIKSKLTPPPSGPMVDARALGIVAGPATPIALSIAKASNPMSPVLIGFTDFVIERANQEIMFNFLEKFKKQLESGTPLTETFKVFFPQSLNFIQNQFQPVYFQRDLGKIKDNLTIDLQSFAINFPEIINTEWFYSISKGNNDVKYIGNILVRVPGLLQNKEAKLDQKLNELFYEMNNFDSKTNLVSLFRVISNLSLSISDPKTKKWYTNLSGFEDEKVRKLYQALLYAKLSKIKFSSDDKLTEKELLKNLPGAYNKIYSFDSKRYSLLELSASNNELLFKNFNINKFNSLVDLLSNSILRWNTIENLEIADDDPYRKLKQEIVFISRIIDNAVSLIDDKGIPQFSQRVNQAKDLIENCLMIPIHFKEKKFDLATIEAINALSAAGLHFLPTEKVLKYASFITQISSAKTSEEVKNLLQSYALPVGGSAIKKTHAFSWGLQTYLGGTIGFENTLDKSNSNDTLKWSGGYDLPVGINLSGKTKKNGSKTIFVNLFNLGSLADFRINDNNVEELTDLKLRNFISLGAGFQYGFPRSPFSIGASLNYRPDYRKDLTISGTDKIFSVYQVRVNASVDIPIFLLGKK